MKNVIVTGANGFIGSSLIRKLVSNHIHVIALDLSFSNSKLPDSALITKIESSLDDLDELLKKIPVEDYDAFYHFAWRGVNGSEKADFMVQLKNVELVVHCAAAAKQLGCKKFLCAGTIAEQAVKSLSNIEKISGSMVYSVAKYTAHLMLEAYCKNIGLEFVWMQLSNIYGPTNKTGNLVSYTIGELVKGSEATFGPAMQPYDFVYVEDVIEAIYRLGEKKVSKNYYFIGSGEPRLLKDYLLEIGKAYGRPDLIKIGVRPDDGILYTFDMFDISSLENDIGDYVSKSFTEGIRYTIENYGEKG